MPEDFDPADIAEEARTVIAAIDAAIDTDPDTVEELLDSFPGEWRVTDVTGDGDWVVAVENLASPACGSCGAPRTWPKGTQCDGRVAIDTTCSCGPRGESHPARWLPDDYTIRELDEWLEAFAEMVADAIGVDLDDLREESGSEASASDRAEARGAERRDRLESWVADALRGFPDDTWVEWHDTLLLVSVQNRAYRTCTQCSRPRGWPYIAFFDGDWGDYLQCDGCGGITTSSNPWVLLPRTLSEEEVHEKIEAIIAEASPPEAPTTINGILQLLTADLGDGSDRIEELDPLAGRNRYGWSWLVDIEGELEIIDYDEETCETRSWLVGQGGAFVGGAYELMEYVDPIVSAHSTAQVERIVRHLDSAAEALPGGGWRLTDPTRGPVRVVPSLDPNAPTHQRWVVEAEESA